MFMLRITSISFSLLIIFFSADAQLKKISVIGSSTAAGTGASTPDSSWVRRINYYYKYQLRNLDSTYNLAVGGYSPYDGMPTSYIPPAGKPGPDPNRNITKALTYSPNVVIVNFPTNRFDIDPISEILFCLQTIYDSTMVRGKRCFITTTQPRHDGNFGTSAIKRKLAVLKDSIINRFGMYSLNFYDGLYNPSDSTILSIYSAGDGIHLNDAGHRILFDRVRTKNIFDVNLAANIKNFAVFISNKQARINWTADQEESQTEYRVQKSTDGSNFRNLTTVKPNTDHSENQYEHIDLKPLPGDNYYRIEINIPGSKRYSKTIKAKNIVNGIGLRRIYPVPSSSLLIIEFASNRKQAVTIEIITGNGGQVSKLNLNTESEETVVTIPINRLKAGYYFVKVYGSNTDPIIQAFVKY